MIPKKIEELEKEQLIERLHVLKKQLDKKKFELMKTKSKLYYTQDKLEKMKACVQYQRGRILELYKEIPQSDSRFDREDLCERRGEMPR